MGNSTTSSTKNGQVTEKNINGLVKKQKFDDTVNYLSDKISKWNPEASFCDQDGRDSIRDHIKIIENLVSHKHFSNYKSVPHV